MVLRRKTSAGLQFFTYGVPFVFVVIGGAWYLSTMLNTQMEMKDKKSRSISSRKFNLEEEHRQLMRRLDIDHFSLSRIPRPPAEDSDATTTTTAQQSSSSGQARRRTGEDGTKSDNK